MKLDERTITQVNELLNKCLVSKAFKHFMFVEHTPSAWYDVEEELDRLIDGSYDIELCEGVTKGVIVDYHNCFAVKFPFIDKYTNNHCAIEYHNSIMFEKAGIGEMIAKTGFMKWCGCPVYVQELVYCNEDDITSEAWESSYASWKAEDCNGEYSEYIDENEATEKFDDWFYSMEGWDQMCDAVEAHWGWIKYNKFLAVISKWNIGDLHTGNFGLREGRIVCVDYSGFRVSSKLFGNKEYWSVVYE